MDVCRLADLRLIEGVPMSEAFADGYGRVYRDGVGRLRCEACKRPTPEITALVATVLRYCARIRSWEEDGEQGYDRATDLLSDIEHDLAVVVAPFEP